jgi:hypothetical protein
MMQPLPTTFIVKGDKFNQNQYPQNTLKNEQVSNIPWKAAKKVIRYLQGIKEYKLTY